MELPIRRATNRLVTAKGRSKTAADAESARRRRGQLVRRESRLRIELHPSDSTQEPPRVVINSPAVQSDVAQVLTRALFLELLGHTLESPVAAWA